MYTVHFTWIQSTVLIRYMVHTHTHTHTHALSQITNTIYMHNTHTLSQPIALLSSEQREHSKVEHGIASLQKDMVRLNALITEKRGEQEKLEQGSTLAENDFIHALKVGRKWWVGVHSTCNCTLCPAMLQCCFRVKTYVWTILPSLLNIVQSVMSMYRIHIVTVFSRFLGLFPGRHEFQGLSS